MGDCGTEAREISPQPLPGCSTGSFSDGSRLADVADEFNRYNARQLVIENAELAEPSH